MMGRPRGTLRQPFSSGRCRLELCRNGKESSSQPTSGRKPLFLVFLRPEPSKGKVTLRCFVPPEPPPAGGLSPVVPPALGSFPPWRWYLSRTDPGQLKTFIQAQATRRRLTCRQPASRWGAWPWEQASFTKDSFLQTGSFDTFTGSAALQSWTHYSPNTSFIGVF